MKVGEKISFVTSCLVLDTSKIVEKMCLIPYSQKTLTINKKEKLLDKIEKNSHSNKCLGSDFG